MILDSLTKLELHFYVVGKGGTRIILNIVESNFKHLGCGSLSFKKIAYLEKLEYGINISRKHEIFFVFQWKTFERYFVFILRNLIPPPVHIPIPLLHLPILGGHSGRESTFVPILVSFALFGY